MSEPHATPSAADAGALLRQARERAGLHIATLAATLKVPVQRLQALEAGAYDALPDATFTRALALSVCRALKIDPAPVLAALPSSGAPRLTPSSGDLAAPMPRRGKAPALVLPSASRPRRAPWGLALLLVLGAALAWWLLPPRDEATEAAGSVTEIVRPVAPAPTAAAAPGSVAAAAVTGAASGPAPDERPAPAEPVPVPALAAPPSAGPATSAAAAPGALVLRASAASWVQVTGASGRVLLQRLVQPGELLRFDDDLPLAVVVGRADATTVEVRGQPLDLSALARNNVARFEVR